MLHCLSTLFSRHIYILNFSVSVYYLQPVQVTCGISNTNVHQNVVFLQLFLNYTVLWAAWRTHVIHHLFHLLTRGMFERYTIARCGLFWLNLLSWEKVLGSDSCGFFSSKQTAYWLHTQNEGVHPNQENCLTVHRWLSGMVSDSHLMVTMRILTKAALVWNRTSTPCIYWQSATELHLPS